MELLELLNEMRNPDLINQAVVEEIRKQMHDRKRYFTLGFARAVDPTGAFGYFVYYLIDDERCGARLDLHYSHFVIEAGELAKDKDLSASVHAGFLDSELHVPAEKTKATFDDGPFLSEVRTYVVSRLIDAASECEDKAKELKAEMHRQANAAKANQKKVKDP